MFEQRATEIADAVFPQGEPSPLIVRLAAPLIMALMCLETGEIVKANHWAEFALERFIELAVPRND